MEYCIRSGIKSMPVNRGRVPTVNCFEKGFSRQMRIIKIKKIPGGFVPSSRLLVHSLHTKKENAVNYGKLAMLYRLAGGGPLAVYASENQADVQKLFNYLQELCCDSKDLEIIGNTIVTGNPFLAHHLQEVVNTQTLVPVNSTFGISGTLII